MRYSGYPPPFQPHSPARSTPVASPCYVRARDLPRLMPLWPDEISDISISGQQRLVMRLKTALRRERQRGLAGDWCYDLARHHQLLIAYDAELALLNATSKRAALRTPTRYL